MLGRSHAVSGWAAGMALGDILGMSPVTTVALGAVTAVGALLPDLDHPGSRASRALPPITTGLSWLLRRASEALYAATKGPRDETWRGGHRHMTHTVAWAALTGLLVGVGVLTGGRAVGWAGAGSAALLAGAGATLGCVVHTLGDSLTLAGCPWLWPLPIAGETWYEIRLLGPLSFRTGGGVERFVVFPLCVVAAGLATPGVWPLAAGIIS